ncbi:hypothetical protein APE_1975.1 [Aeropyrum pernix K1]|uniref:Uncharacterized protein n=1 Tax=Aeropyrum pernix (strain ATCC 700893 / DSM 11879 / JCM 9820 / NBRC 100138 / K1) TaxID=272557 RepID=Q9YAG4_AERPE|nr:Snf7 family protein [Aeropyrum pernix]BAA80985.2 hypothetical protein APE_1975.1 [Aeropyrum pernix K1]
MPFWLGRRRRKAGGRREIVEALATVRQARFKLKVYKSRLHMLESEDAERLASRLEYIDYILEAVGLRLETILALQPSIEAVEDLMKLPYELVKQAAKQAQDLPPDITSLLTALEQSLASAIPEDTLIELGPGPETLSPQARDILREAEKRAGEAASKRVREQQGMQ